MHLPRSTWIAAAVVALAVAGCKVNTINNFPTKPVPVRFVNMMSDAPGLDVKKDGDVVWSAVPFPSATPYQDFENKQTQFDIFPTGGTSSLVSISGSLAAQASYTLVGFGVVDAASALFQQDTFLNPNPGNAQFRIMHAAYSAGGFDFYLNSPPGQPIGNVSPLFQMGYSGSTAFVRTNTGDYQLRLVRASSSLLAFDSGLFALPDQATLAWYIYVKDSTHAPNILQLDVGSGATSELPNPLAAVKVINAAYQAGAVDQLFDGNAVVTNLAYPAATQTYYTLPAGTHTITFESHATPGAAIASASETFTASTDTTLLLSGANGSLSITPLPDHDVPPRQGTARVRVVNASPDVPAFDLAVDDVVKAANVGYTQASAYFDTSDSNHKIEFRVPGTTTSLLTLDSQQFGSGQVSTLYLVGPAGSLAKLLTPDSV
jgi:hypothetical protein